MGRRTILKGGAALAGARAGTAGHPGLPGRACAADPVTLRYLGTAVNQDKAIAEKFKADTGITIQYVAVTTDDVTKRAVTPPNSFDLIDTEYFSLKKIVPTGNLMGIDAKKIKNADKITTLFTKGEVGGKTVGDQGTAPKKVIYLEGPTTKKFAKAPTQFMTLIPTVYNADTLGIRPDLIKRPIESWKELLNPEFKGKASILNIPSIGIMDAAMVVEAMGLYKYPDKGNMTKKEIDLTIKTLIEAKKAGQFRALVEGLQRERQPDGLGRGGDPVDVVAGRDRGALQGHRLHLPAAQGRLSRLGRRLRPAEDAERARSSTRAYEFINWFLDGWAGAYLNRQGYYSAVLETAKAKMEPYEWAYWMEGKPAEKDIKAPNGDLLDKAGAVRDGGSYEERMGGSRLLERGDGREQLHGPEVERVRRGVARDAAEPRDVERACRQCGGGPGRGPSPRDTLTRIGLSGLDGATRSARAPSTLRRSHGPEGRAPALAPPVARWRSWTALGPRPRA